MAKLKVTCRLNDYSEPAMPSVIINAHWNNQKLVELEVDGKKYTVDGEQLKKAVDNCMNT